MKCRIKTRDLRHAGRGDRNRADRGDVVGLMQWRQWNQGLERRDHSLIDHHRLRKLAAAMNDAMTDTGKTRGAAEIGDEPVIERGDGSPMIRTGDLALGQLPSRGVGYFK